MVKDIVPWICSWRDVLGLQAQSSHKESAGCSVGFGSMPHEAIFTIPAVLRKLFDILRDREPCCPWDKADCSFWQHVPHPTTPADSAHGEQISLPCHSALHYSWTEYAPNVTVGTPSLWAGTWHFTSENRPPLEVNPRPKSVGEDHQGQLQALSSTFILQRGQKMGHSRIASTWNRGSWGVKWV